MRKTESFAARLRSLRESAGMSIVDLAEKAGIPRQTVHLLENGDRQPSLATAAKLAEALGKTLSAFDGCTLG